MYERRRNIVVRPDGRRVNVARPRGQLFVCATGCCCGRTEDGFAPVPADTLHTEWERRRLRNVVHLTIGGCLGPCALANVALLLFDGEAQWFHSVNSPAMARALYDHIERMLEADACLPPPPPLAAFHFTASAWQPRPDGQPVDDVRPRRSAPAAHGCAIPSGVSAAGAAVTVDGLVAAMAGAAALPRKNGELVFDEPWHGRVFGMAVALHEGGAFQWEEFRQALIAHVASASARGGPFAYYEVWLATFEHLLTRKGLVTREEVDETTYQFEF
ncbi:MAG TPA: nitrile hydratase accessory protein, partial [Candidatus Limnocylindrales bacterium]|nr:nitrile hydratase accessory protein [Candidatus Limnocylindrales bacterium]